MNKVACGNTGYLISVLPVSLFLADGEDIALFGMFLTREAVSIRLVEDAPHVVAKSFTRQFEQALLHGP